MVIKRIKDKNDMPKWFKLNNYEIIKELNEFELLIQLRCRFDSLKALDLIGSLSSDYFPIPEVVYTSINLHRCLWENGEIIIPKLEAFTGLNRSCYHKDTPGFLNECLYQQKLRLQPIYLDLLLYTDEELEQQFKSFLKQSRIKEAIPNPKRLNNSFSKLRLKNILEYKIFEQLDLMIWCKLEGYKIAQKILAAALFTEGNVDYKAVALKLLNDLKKEDFDFHVNVNFNTPTALTFLIEHMEKQERRELQKSKDL